MAKFVCLVALIAFYYVNGVPLSADTGSNRIINGNAAYENQFQYAVSIQSILGNAQQTETRGHRCGGVLVSFQHVLTTASCVTDVAADGSTTVLNTNSYQVFAGSRTLTNSSADRVRPISSFTIHPDFVRSPASLNDIAVITLNVPFANTTVVPLSLPAATFNPADFTLCTVAGWGASTNQINAVASVQLRYASKYIYNQNLCTTLYSGLSGVANVFDTMVCAASYDIISNGCTGDIGNALVCDNTLTGLMFFHNNCNASSYPELYTRVSNYTTWIRSITGSATTFTPGLFMLSLLTISQIFVAKVVS